MTKPRASLRALRSNLLGSTNVSQNYVMFLLSSSLFLIAIFSQLIVGSLVMSKKIKFSFGWLTLTNWLFISIVTYVLIQIIIPKNEGPQCGILQMSAFILGIGAMTVQIIIAILQSIWLNKVK